MTEIFTGDGRLCFLLFAVYAVWLESSQVQCQQLCAISIGNVSLDVRAIVTPSTILLICSGNTSGGQFLKWTERGKNIPAAVARTYRRFNVSTATEEVSVVFNNPGVFDYGIFTCHCYSMAGDSSKSAERKHLRSRQQIMRQNKCSYSCSEPVSVSALPSESISVVEHFFKSKRQDELIQISCQNSTSQMLASRSMISADSPSSIYNNKPLMKGGTILKWPHYASVKSPSNERKYICLGLNRNLEEIHYLITPSALPQDISSISLSDVTPPTSSPKLSFPSYRSTQSQSNLIASVSTIPSAVRQPRSELIVTQLLQPPTTIISDSNPAATDQQSLTIIYAVSIVTVVIVLVSAVVLILLLCYVRKLCRSIAEHSTPSVVDLNGCVQRTAVQDNVYVITPSV